MRLRAAAAQSVPSLVPAFKGRVKDELRDNVSSSERRLWRVKRGEVLLLPGRKRNAGEIKVNKSEERWDLPHQYSERLLKPHQRITPERVQNTSRSKSSFAVRNPESKSFEVEAVNMSEKSVEHTGEKKLKHVVQIINLQHKIAVMQAKEAQKSILSDRPKTHRRKTEISQEKEMGKDRWTALFDEADKEVNQKLRAILQSKHEENIRRVRFAKQAEVFNKSPVRSRSYLKKYKDILDIEDGEAPSREEKARPITHRSPFRSYKFTRRGAYRSQLKRPMEEFILLPK